MPSQIQSWVDRANQIFAPAGIQLMLEPVSGSFLWNSSINSMTNNPSSQGFKDATQVAKQFPDKIVVFFRNVQGNGFSDGSYKFVAMPRFVDSFVWPGVQGDNSRTQNIGQLAHDIGHYLGLPHTFPGNSDPGFTILSATKALLMNGWNVNIFDGDGLSDTPPDPGVGIYDNPGPGIPAWNHCNSDHPSYMLDRVTITPDRHNLMSYFPCEPNELSPMQIARMREVLLSRAQLGLDISQFGQGFRLNPSSSLTSWSVDFPSIHPAIHVVHPHVVGLGGDGTLNEWFFIPTSVLNPEIGTWQHGNINNNTPNLPNLAPGSSLTSWIFSNGDEHVVGLGADGTVHGFYFIPRDGSWKHEDISSATGVKLAPGSSLTSWIFSNGDEHVVGLGADGTVHGFYFIPRDGSWKHEDISSATGVKLAPGSSLTSWIMRTNEHIAGLTEDGSLHEFLFIPNVGHWQHVH
jgi:hypothetical protein